MNLLKRLFGGGDDRPSDPLGGRPGDASDVAPPATAEELVAAEQTHELDVLREEAARLDELQQRQLRYADKAWTPPAQGGERRADEEADADR